MAGAGAGDTRGANDAAGKPVPAPTPAAVVLPLAAAPDERRRAPLWPSEAAWASKGEWRLPPALPLLLLVVLLAVVGRLGTGVVCVFACIKRVSSHDEQETTWARRNHHHLWTYCR